MKLGFCRLRGRLRGNWGMGIDGQEVEEAD